MPGKKIVVLDEETGESKVFTVSQEEWDSKNVFELGGQKIEKASLIGHLATKVTTPVTTTAKAGITGFRKLKDLVKGAGHAIKQGVVDAAAEEDQRRAAKKIEKQMEKACIAEVHEHLDPVLAKKAEHH